MSTEKELENKKKQLVWLCIEKDKLYHHENISDLTQTPLPWYANQKDVYESQEKLQICYSRKDEICCCSE